MNELIRELALQAEIDANKLIDNNGIDPRQYPRYFAEKFAELIVRECVRYFNEDYQRDFNTLWREDLTKGIKKHFGVED